LPSGIIYEVLIIVFCLIGNSIFKGHLVEL
jgi:hypothetical protein